MPITRTRRLAASALLLAGLAAAACAAEYFVAPEGRDAADGIAPQTAFATIQRGVDALAPGDTLTILPGEYFGPVRRDGLGHTGVVTTIRAAIPGTVVLRGDVPLGTFRRAEGCRSAYVTDLGGTGTVVVVNEVDTLRILDRVPNLAELDFLPGVMYHDPVAGKLFITTPDLQPPDRHRYTATRIGSHGLYLSRARRVVVEGLAATGFNAMKPAALQDRTLSSVWGIFLANGRDCVVRNCRAWMNGNGIGLNSRDETSGDNVIEGCVAWANRTEFGVGDRGGITAIEPRRDVIRTCTAFLNGRHGINIYLGGASARELRNKSRLLNNLAWGHEVDYKIKTGGPYVHAVEHCAGPGPWSLNHDGPAIHCLLRSRGDRHGQDTINLAAEPLLDMAAEFADPANHDYRLQATSRFRGTGPAGSDRGPHRYAPNVFYVRPDGSDAADGLSVATAWRSPARAAKDLKAGDTLYLLSGVYEGGLTLAGFKAGPAVPSGPGAPDEAPLSIRGRGTEPVILRGTVTLSAVRADFQRLTFEGPVTILPPPTHPALPHSHTPTLSFSHCRFTAPQTCLAAEGIAGLAVTHCAFTNFAQSALSLNGCTAVDLRGNRFDNAPGIAAVQLDRQEALLYAGYNGYLHPDGAWQVGGIRLPPAPGLPTTRQAGPFDKPLGPCNDAAPDAAPGLVFGPVARSVSATTANIEWMTTLPATCSLRWGETPACTNDLDFDVAHFGSFSLTGLQPGRTYFFRIEALRTPRELAQSLTAVAAEEPVTLNTPPISFATLLRNPEPAVYHVAPDGYDGNTGLSAREAWKTLQHAADSVNAGDTVLVLEGTYVERVLIRATGTPSRPITFRAVPGHQVIMDGGNAVLDGFFIAHGKQNLRFDGFRFRNANRKPWSRWPPGQGGEFNLHCCSEIEITRCLSDGRGGKSSEFLYASRVANLTIRNCVTIGKFGTAYFLDCPGLQVANCVFARPMISSFLLGGNRPDERAAWVGNIFTDNLQKKADANVPFLSTDYPIEAMWHSNNCYMVRGSAPMERQLMWKRTLVQLRGFIHAPLLADPGFAGDPTPGDRNGFAPDRLADSRLALDFDSFFATNPEVVRRGMGLQPEVFRDRGFKQGDGNKQWSSNPP